MFPAQVEEVIAATSGTSSEYQVMIEHIMGRDVLTVLFETSLEGEALQRCEEELALIFKAKIGGNCRARHSRQACFEEGCYRFRALERKDASSH